MSFNFEGSSGKLTVYKHGGQIFQEYERIKFDLKSNPVQPSFFSIDDF
jgi:hypothetical protein